MDLADLKEQQVMPCRAFGVRAPESDRITGGHGVGPPGPAGFSKLPFV